MNHMLRFFLTFAWLLLAAVGQSRTIVVSVGICKYAHVRALRQAENDARSMATLYRSRAAEVTVLLGADATHERVVQTLRDAFAKARPEDTVVFFFSGHGGKGGICAYDSKDAASCISYAEIARAVKECVAENKQLYIDACYSGGLRLKGKPGAGMSARTAFSDTEGVMLFLSSRSGETSQENPYGPNGQFTKYLVRGLKGGADDNRNRIVEAHELFRFVSEKVAAATKDRQHPVMWGRFNDAMHLMNWNAL